MIVCYQYAIDVADALGSKNYLESNFIIGRYEFIKADNTCNHDGESKYIGVAYYTPICAWRIKNNKSK